MRLPENSLIAEEKLTHYLLVSQTRGDKSALLAKAGYTLGNPEQLLQDLRQQILPLEANPVEANQFGQFYEIHSGLTGPNGVKLHVRRI